MAANSNSIREKQMEYEPNSPQSIFSVSKTSQTFSHKEIDSIYGFVVILYDRGSYADASTLCLLLNFLQPADPFFLGAQARCRKMMRDYPVAATLFQFAATLNKPSPEYLLHAAECYLLTGEKVKAAEILEEVLITPELRDNFPTLYSQSQIWLELLSRGRDE